MAALWSKKQTADFLGFHVSYLGAPQFRYLIWEIFFRAEYYFKTEQEAPVILDCGANIGLATLFFKRLYPKARIASFEADPTTAGILKRNIEQNHLEDVQGYNLMLGNKSGECPFYIDADADGGLTMSADPELLSHRREILVRTGRLSEYINRPVDLLKLDVEGGEFEVLADLRESGKISQVRSMIIEYHHKIGNQPSRMAKFLAQLEETGFEYQISGHCVPITTQNKLQTIMIGAYRSEH